MNTHTMAPRAFLAGHPVKHSRSPLIHGHWLRRAGLAGTYELIDVAPAEIEGFLRSFRDRGFVGGNITIPHKEAAFRSVDRVTERARRIGAVNTVYHEGHVLVGDNTDGHGFTAHLDDTFGPDWPERAGSALVLGAGGAARAIACALVERGIRRITIANRSRQRAEALAEDLLAEPGPRPGVSVVPWESITGELPGTGLLVNTTSLGMAGQPPLDLDLEALPATALVSDIVYVPLETPLLARARQRGLTVADGLGMLLHQAVPGFAAWFGPTPVVDEELRARVVADLPA